MGDCGQVYGVPPGSGEFVSLEVADRFWQVCLALVVAANLG